MIVHDAAATFVVVVAAHAWVPVLAGVAAVVLCAVPLCVAPGVRGVRKGVTGPSWARGSLRARILARARVRRSTGRTEPRAPSWAHTEPYDYEEAAA